MLIFLGLIFVLYGGLHYYALSKVWQALPHSALLGGGLAMWGVFMTVAPLLVWFLVKSSWHGTATALSWLAYCWMGFLFLFCSIALLVDLARVLAGWLGVGWHLHGVAALLAVGVPALALAGYAFFEAGQVRVEQLTVSTPKLASGRVKIAQISDLHLGLMLGDSLLNRVTAILRQASPDVIVATGDMIDGQGDDLQLLAAKFRRLAPQVPMYAILGNHEAFAGAEASVKFFHDAGFTVLRGDTRQTDGVIFVGVDDATLGAGMHPLSQETQHALAAARDHAYVVLLKHQPVVDDAVPFDLQLSGHAHGGQIFPFGLFTLMAYGVRAGTYRYDGGRTLYINRGAGTWGPPMRLLAPPEVTLVTIESSAPSVTNGGQRNGMEKR